MPSAVVHKRICLDETSLDFRGLTADILDDHVDDLNSVLADLRRRAIDVLVHPWLWDGIECLDGVLICDFLYRKGKVDHVSRDTRLRLATLLDRCATWPEDEPGCVDAVAVFAPDDGGKATSHDPALSIGIALTQTIAGHHMACLVFSAAERRGLRRVHGSSDGAEIFFFAHREELATFWRSLYSCEQIKEGAFFELAEYAFPRLVLHPSLSFGHFEGRYLDVRDKVVRILSAVNDRFAAAMEQYTGVPHDVAAAFGSAGVDLSPESPKTRGSEALMAHRMASLGGKTYRCEWHAKLEPHRNRIHFSLPVAELDGRIVVGRFAVHLPT